MPKQKLLRSGKPELLMLISHILLCILLILVLAMPKGKSNVRAPYALLAGLVLIEFLFLAKYRRRCRKGEETGSLCSLLIFVWGFLILWETLTSVLNVMQPVLVPAPENVFDVFRTQWKKMLTNVAYSMELLSLGFITGKVLGILLGAVAAWKHSLRNFLYPIANVLSPIPAIVFSPYLVAVMPTFRSASVLVIILGTFWPTLLGTINQISAMDRRILDSAAMLRLNDFDMIFRILIPAALPGIIRGLKVSVTTSVMMLNFAELMGASHGMGYYIQNSIAFANYTQAIAGIICIGIVVTLLNRLVDHIQKHALPWV